MKNLIIVIMVTLLMVGCTSKDTKPLTDEERKAKYAAMLKQGELNQATRKVQCQSKVPRVRF